MTVQGENNFSSTHSPAYALDLVPDRRPNMNPKLAGHMDCSACRGTFLFYDRLRHVAIAKLDHLICCCQSTSVGVALLGTWPM